MVEIFKKRHNLLVVLLFIFLVALRLPILLAHKPVSLYELKWLLIGERMASGFSLYDGIWTTLEPFSGGIYWLVNLISGRSFLILNVIALFLVFFQGIYLNRLMDKFRIIEKLGYLPTLVYFILTFLSIEYLTLSPPLMGSTFIIISFRYLFDMPAEKNADAQIMYAGICIGIASLFYFPFMINIKSTFCNIVISNSKALSSSFVINAYQTIFTKYTYFYFILN